MEEYQATETPQPQYMQPPMQTPNPDLPTQDFYWFRLQSGDIIEEIEHKLKGEILVTNSDGSYSYQKKFPHKRHRF